jgi:hypothetical protein
LDLDAVLLEALREHQRGAEFFYRLIYGETGGICRKFEEHPSRFTEVD